MIGLVVVSHSPQLAQAAVDLAKEMVADRPPQVAIAAGAAVDGSFGTDAISVKAAIEQVDDGDGVVVLMDLGSAVLSAETALDFIDPELRRRVHLTAAPLVEGLVAAVVQAAAGAAAEVVVAEAAAGLHGKEAHLGAATAAPEEIAVAAGEWASFVVMAPHGLHARPAARLVATVKRFDANVLVRNGTTGSGFAPAASLSRVAAIGARKGHEVEVVASGRQAREALQEIVALATRDFDQTPSADAPRQPVPSAGQPLPAAPGIGIGRKWTMREDDITVPAAVATQPDIELRNLQDAIASTRSEITATHDRLIRTGDQRSAAIFDAHLLLLDDDEITQLVEAAIHDGATAAEAWKATLEVVAAAWAQLDDPYLNARAADVRAVCNQLLRHLLGTEYHIASQRGILVAAELTPADVARLDTDLVSGIVTAHGSPTSHTAILAQALDIPTVVAAGNAVLEVADGTEMIVDGAAGIVLVDPPLATVEVYHDQAEQQAAAATAARRREHEAAVTTDGVVIEVAANAGSTADVAAVGASGADAVGVLRTEFFFINRAQPPTAAEQEAEYRWIADKLGGRRLTIRTLDGGADKPLNYLPMPQEDNPFLGIRGIRLSLLHPELFEQQLAAAVRVARDHPVSVMFPMITAVTELEQALAALDRVCIEEGGRPEQLEAGMMIEVPAVAANAAAFTSKVDFVSIGTNDLAQYALAAERGNENVAHLADALDPGLLRLIQSVVAAAGDTKVAVCGELAADLTAVPVLVGLGVEELSVTRSAVPWVKETVRQWSQADAAALAGEAMTLDSAAAVRTAVAEWRKKFG